MNDKKTINEAAAQSQNALTKDEKTEGQAVMLNDVAIYQAEQEINKLHNKGCNRDTCIGKSDLIKDIVRGDSRYSTPAPAPQPLNNEGLLSRHGFREAIEQVMREFGADAYIHAALISEIMDEVGNYVYQPAPAPIPWVYVGELIKELNDLANSVVTNNDKFNKIFSFAFKLLDTIEKAQEGQRRHVVIKRWIKNQGRWDWDVVNLETKTIISTSTDERISKAKADELDGVGVVEEPIWSESLNGQLLFKGEYFNNCIDKIRQDAITALNEQEGGM